VIAISGYATDRSPEQLVAEGFAAFVAKPFRTAALAAAVRRLLDEASADP
jgi:CheY-like chemotaxis protein